MERRLGSLPPNFFECDVIAPGSLRDVAVLAQLNKLKESIPKMASEALEEGGNAVAQRSRELAPVDLGNLEAAHTVDTKHKGHKVIVTISVGGHVDGIDVDDYVAEMHEGSYELGPRSQAKDNATGQPVGSKFLERAVDENKDDIEATVREAVLKAVLGR
jgi:hypothetical protein